MKKLLFFLFLFSSVVFAQNFTIRSQTAHGSILNTDMWLMSNSAGVYTNLTYLQLKQALDDETWTWTGINTFEGALIIDGSAGGRLALQSSQSPFYTGELSVTTGSTYMKFQSDTVASWAHVREDDITITGDWTFNGNLKLGTAGAFYTSLSRVGSNGSGFVIYAYGTGLTDTLLTKRALRADDYTISGDWFFPYIELSSAPVSYESLGKVGGSGTSEVAFRYGVGLTDTLLSRRALRDNNITFNGDLTRTGRIVDTPPSVVTLGAGQQNVTVTASYMILDGNATATTVVDFIGTPVVGERITIQAYWNDADGFTIEDDTAMQLDGNIDMVFTAGDIAEFIYASDGFWYSTGPKADN